MAGAGKVGSAAGEGARAAWVRAQAAAVDWPIDRVIFVLALGLFVGTRLIGLERFPIYFFTDEAIQAVHASDFVDNGFRDEQGRLFPTYFRNASYWNLSTSVYAQVIPTALFGHSVFVTRAVSALIALTAAAAVSLTLRDVFKVQAWWVAALFLAVTPAFFYHSRTAFETVLGASMYAWFLYFYLRYITQRGWNLYAALVFGALTFYSYAPLQLVVVTTGLALGLSNVRLHVQEWRTSLWSLALVLLLAAPYARFYFDQGEEPYLHLRTLESYWVEPGLSVGDKIDRFSDEYRLALTPSYWFGTRNTTDLVRHQMKGYGHISSWAAPFIFLGIGYCMRRIRSAPHRALLISLALAPLGAALVHIQITRALVMVIPAALLAGLGAALVIDWLGRRIWYEVVAAATFTLFLFGGAYMLTDSLRNGSTWYDDYGLFGMQYGARQVSAEVSEQLEASPGRQVVLSPSWANGTDVTMRFLLVDEWRLQLRSIEDYRRERLPIAADTIFILPPWEYQAAADDPRFTLTVLKTLPYPDGRPGFYVTQLAYSAEADEIFAREQEDRSRPVVTALIIDAAPATVTHSPLDIGTLEGMFDHDTFTLGRTAGANPMVVDIMFDTPRTFTSVTLQLRTVRHVKVVAQVYGTEGGDPQEYIFTRDPLWEEETVIELPLPDAPTAPRIRLEIHDLNSPPGNANVHVREIELR